MYINARKRSQTPASAPKRPQVPANARDSPQMPAIAYICPKRAIVQYNPSSYLIWPLSLAQIFILSADFECCFIRLPRRNSFQTIISNFFQKVIQIRYFYQYFNHPVIHTASQCLFFFPSFLSFFLFFSLTFFVFLFFFLSFFLFIRLSLCLLTIFFQ